MKVEISVPEVVSIFKEIQEQPERLFEMIRVDVRQKVGSISERYDGRGAYPFFGSRTL